MGEWSSLSYALVAFVGVVAFLRLVANEIHAKCAGIEQRRERIELETLARRHRQEQQAAAAKQAGTFEPGDGATLSDPGPST